MLGFYLLPLLPILGLTVAGQEAFELVHLHEPEPRSLHSLPWATGHSLIGVSVSKEDLPDVSSSVLAAETWLRSHVLAHYPSTRITSIIVGRGVLCNRDHEHLWGLILPSAKNLYHSLVRWGLVKDIKVSAALSDCLKSSSSSLSSFGAGMTVDVLLKPLVKFLQETSSAYAIDLPSHSSDITEAASLFSSAAAERLGLSKLRDVRVVKEAKPISRRLSSKHRRSPSLLYPPPPPNAQFSFAPNAPPEVIPAYPPPNLAPALPPLAGPPSVPANPPDVYAMPPPAPVRPPVVPANPPDAFAMPPPLPCIAAPVASVAPPPGLGEVPHGGLWCVAKPTVPEEKLQEALNYACGEGGADCKEIRPDGSCYYPDTVMAHASYAFNSYWQKAKQSGGSCTFDGTAVLINSDPSFLQCRFVLS